MSSVTKIIFITLFVNSSHSIFGQNYVNSYHPIINKAEMHLIQGNYESAINEYNNAFILKGFGKDYYNAAVASMKLNQPDSAFKFLIHLSNKGLDLNTIVNTNVFEPLIFTTNWEKFQLKYLSNLVAFIKSQDKTLMNELNELYKIDQAYRGFNNSYEDNGLMPIIRNIDSLNVKKLVKIIEKQGYPDENIWGLDSIDHFHPFDLVIWHQANHKYQFFSFEKILFDAIYTGKLNPEYGGFLIENNNGNGKFWTNLIYKITLGAVLKAKYPAESISKWRLFNKFSNNTILVNKSRSSIGLRSIEDYKNILCYKFQNPNSDFILLPKITYPTFEVEDEDSYKSLLSTSKELDCAK